mgnify:CR=1 FL=1
MTFDINSFFSNFDLITLRKVFKADFMTKEQCVTKFKDVDDLLGELFDLYVPNMGAANTIGGECVRALNRIVYRYYNDGDVAGYNYGVTTVANSLGYLVNLISDVTDTAADLISYTDCCPGYVNALDDLIYKTLSCLFNNSDFFDTANTEDSNENGYWEYIFDDEDDYNYRLNGEEDSDEDEEDEWDDSDEDDEDEEW